MFDTDRSGTIGFNEFWLVTGSLVNVAVEFLISNDSVDYGDSWQPGGHSSTASIPTRAATLVTGNLPTLWLVRYSFLLIFHLRSTY